MKNLLFIQGSGDNGYQADAKIVSRLEKLLGKKYKISYRKLGTDERQPDFGWLKQIGRSIAELKDGDLLAGHSLVASMLLKWLSENKIPIKPMGVFLLATPFWSGHEDWQQGLKLQKDFAEKISNDLPLYFYHCRDDHEIPFEQMGKYQQNISKATFREIQGGGHMFDGALGFVVADIISLK